MNLACLRLNSEEIVDVPSPVPVMNLQKWFVCVQKTSSGDMTLLLLNAPFNHACV